MPRQETHVMIRIQATPAMVTAAVFAARSSRPNSRKPWTPAIWANAAITITSAASMAHPVSHPVCGPNARATQVKLVPQSGLSLLRGGLDADLGGDAAERRGQGVAGGRSRPPRS
jgi:hypothetical protein